MPQIAKNSPLHDSGFGEGFAFLSTGGIYAFGGDMAMATETQQPDALPGGAIVAAVGFLLVLYGWIALRRYARKGSPSV